MLYQELYRGFPELIQWSSIAYRLLPCQLFGQFNAGLEDVFLLLLGHLIRALEIHQEKLVKLNSLKYLVRISVQSNLAARLLDGFGSLRKRFHRVPR